MGKLGRSKSISIRESVKLVKAMDKLGKLGYGLGALELMGASFGLERMLDEPDNHFWGRIEAAMEAEGGGVEATEARFERMMSRIRPKIQESYGEVEEFENALKGL